MKALRSLHGGCKFFDADGVRSGAVAAPGTASTGDVPKSRMGVFLLLTDFPLTAEYLAIVENDF